jgi:acetyltransferase-like isoleucine patch superfamily enzyme
MSLKEKISFYSKNPFRILATIIIRIPYFKFVRQTTDYQNPNKLVTWYRHKILNRGGNRRSYWPVHSTSKVTDPENVYAGVDTCPGLMGGCYIQSIGKIYIGDYTQIAPNVIIISANHDLYDSRKHIISTVKIGKYCWLGAGCKIMPGVEIGDFTIVAAGAVVTKSFQDGHCVIGGVPAKKIKDLERDKCIPFKNKYEYNGYIPSYKFEEYRKKYLKV